MIKNIMMKASATNPISMGPGTGTQSNIVRLTTDIELTHLQVTETRTKIKTGVNTANGQ